MTKILKRVQKLQVVYISARLACCFPFYSMLKVHFSVLLNFDAQLKAI
jgi:hypothetical protein